MSKQNSMNLGLVRPKISVVICSLNGAAGVDRCIRAVATQTIRSSLEVIVVDDGSTDNTSDVGRAHSAIVIRHATNLGLASARNSGLAVATAPIVAFLDDDCEPEPEWAERLLTGYRAGVIGVGGPILARARHGFMLGYLERNNPLRPLESNLAKSGRSLYRLKLYLRRQWAPSNDLPHGEVYSFAGANMSFLRQALIDIGQFDTRFHFGSEELDLCMRLTHAFPSGRLVFDPRARVVHHFKPSLYDALRRSRAYGFGSARLYRKWPSVPPTIFPGPFLILAILLLCIPVPLLLAVAVAIPQLLYPRGLRSAFVNRSVPSLLDAYIQVAQEACGNIGFFNGLWRFRYLVSEARTKAVQTVEAQQESGLAP